MLYIDAKNLYGHSTYQPLPYDEIKFDKNVNVKNILNTNIDSEIGYLVEVDFSHPEKIRQKTKHFPFAPENKKICLDDFSDYRKNIKPDTSTPNKKLICDWSDKKNYLTHYRMLKFYIEHGMMVDKVHSVISIKQDKLFEK